MDVRTPSLGADADVRVALSLALAEAAGRAGERPAPGLLSGDGPLVLPEPLDETTARRLLDALAEGAPPAYGTPAALVASAEAAFAAYLAARAVHEGWAGVSVDAVAEACGPSGGGGVDDRSALERFTAHGATFSDWRALMEAPLHLSLRWLGHRAAQEAIEAERRGGG